MNILKKIIIILLTINFISLYGAQEAQQTNDEVILLSSDLKQFKVKTKFAELLNFINYEPSNDNTKTVKTGLESSVLNALFQATNIIIKNEPALKSKEQPVELVQDLANKIGLKEFFELIQDNVINKLNINERKLFIDSMFKLYSQDPSNYIYNFISNAILDQYAKDLYFEKITFSDIKNLDSSLFFGITKYYYLRVGRNIIPLKILDFGTDINKQIYSNLKISIADLFRYSSKFKLENCYRFGELDFSGFYLTTLEGIENIPGIENVQSLNLSNNLLFYINNYSFKKLGLLNLKHLDLKDNNITRIGNSLVGLDLHTLDLSINKISTLSNDLASQINLYRLDVSNNRIANLEQSLATLINLKDLNISHNLIQNLSNSLSNLDLIDLDTSFNSIQDLNDSLINQFNLQTLDLNYNHITDLKDSLNNLRSLRRLYLSNNNISRLENSLIPLANLEALYLNNNKINQIGKSLNNKKFLHSIAIAGNPLSEQSINLFEELRNKGVRVTMSSNVKHK